MSRRAELARTIWGDVDPFAAPLQATPDVQGWASDHPYLARAVDDVRPQVVVEIGAWKGGSAITLAERIREIGIDGAVIAIDTWLGSWDHWLQPRWRAELGLETGYPTLYRVFAANIAARALTDLVVPLPLDSLNAARTLDRLGIRPDVLHVDGAHDFAAVTADLEAWWPLLRAGGVLVGNDYHVEGDTWPEVRAAFQAFFGTADIEATGGKCYIRKATPRPGPLYLR